MDSTTSGSMQSSSGGGGGGGDEEYTSQPDFLSSFLTLPPPPPPQPPSSSTSHLLLHHHHHHHHHHPSPSFDSFSTFLDPLPHPLPQNPTPPSTTNPFPHSPSPLPNPTCTAAQPDRPAAPGPVRASKKRSRTSRRPPTTVLTTDTSNFRAMVQEFTGFPAPPFSSSFARPRLDLFQSPYLLRPFAQKNHVSSFAPINTTSTTTTTSSSSSTAASVVDAIASIARNSLVNLNTLLASTSATSASVPIDHQHPNLPPFALLPQPAAPKEFAVGDLGSFLGSESLIRPADWTPNSLSIWADGLGLDGGDRDPLIGSGSAAAKRSTDVDKGLR